MYFSAKTTFQLAVAALTLSGAAASSSSPDPSLSSNNPNRPDFHDDANLINERLQGRLPAEALTTCENLSEQELDERLYFIHELKSEDLHEYYEGLPYDDNRKDPGANMFENDEEEYDVEGHEDDAVTHALKCRDLIISYVHRITPEGKEAFLETFTLPLLAAVDNDVRRRWLAEVGDISGSSSSKMHRVLC